MSKIPYIERDPMNGGLRGECAYVWALFLANEADMRDDIVEYDKFKALAEQLAPRAERPGVSSVFYGELEDAIKRYER